jgi:hypothetical protein
MRSIFIVGTDRRSDADLRRSVRIAIVDLHPRFAIRQMPMRLTTLMEILESEIGASSSARSELARLVAERGNKDTAAPARARASETAAAGGRRERGAGRGE